MRALTELVRPNILRLTPYSSARHEFEGTAEVFLDANENPFNTGLNRYPDPLQHAVKEKISALKNVPTENIFLGNGSDEVIDLLLRIFCEPRKDHIIILPPTYGMYKVSASISDVEVREVPLQTDFQPDVEAVLAKADTHSKLLFICSPNNPTGNSMNRAKVRQLIAEFDGIVVVDEAYIDFAEQESCSALLSEYPNLIVMQTFSKAWGLAAIRLGMAFASEEIIQLFNKVKPPYNVNELTQQRALEALNEQHTQEMWVDQLLAQRKVVQQALTTFDFVEKIYPSDANFLLVKVPDPQELYNFLVIHQIIVRNRSTVLLCEGCLRITIGTEAENLKLLQVLQQYETAVQMAK